MGSLTFEPALKRGERWAEGKINLDELSDAVPFILAGTPSHVLEAFLSGGASPNGARPKILARESKGKLYVGDNSIKGSEWLIKFRSPEDHRDIGKVEYIFSLMARIAGLRVPETKLFSTKKGDFFGGKRFDRDNDSNPIHTHTVSGLLHASPVNFSVGYEHFAKLAMALTNDAREVLEVFKIAVFNVMASNQDDHTKNVSFLMDKEGTWSVAPAYDLTFHRNQSGQHKMAIMGNGSPTLDNLTNFGRELGITNKAVTQAIEAVRESISQFPKLAKEFELTKGERERVGAVLNEKVSEGKVKRVSAPKRRLKI